jgi:hypothetical protein
MGWCTDLACFSGLAGQTTCCVLVSQFVARPGSYLIRCCAALVTCFQRCAVKTHITISSYGSFRLAEQNALCLHAGVKDFDELGTDWVTTCCASDMLVKHLLVCSHARCPCWHPCNSPGVAAALAGTAHATWGRTRQLRPRALVAGIVPVPAVEVVRGKRGAAQHCDRAQLHGQGAAGDLLRMEEDGRYRHRADRREARQELACVNPPAPGGQSLSRLPGRRCQRCLYIRGSGVRPAAKISAHCQTGAAGAASTSEAAARGRGQRANARACPPAGQVARAVRGCGAGAEEEVGHGDQDVEEGCQHRPPVVPKDAALAGELRFSLEPAGEGTAVGSLGQPTSSCRSTPTEKASASAANLHVQQKGSGLVCKQRIASQQGGVAKAYTARANRDHR